MFGTSQLEVSSTLNSGSTWSQRSVIETYEWKIYNSRSRSRIIIYYKCVSGYLIDTWYRRKDQTNEIYILHTDLPFTRALILGTKPWFSWWFRIVNGNSDQESLHNDKELLNNGGYTHSPDTGWSTDVSHATRSGSVSLWIWSWITK